MISGPNILYCNEKQKFKYKKEWEIFIEQL